MRELAIMNMGLKLPYGAIIIALLIKLVFFP